MSIAQALAMTAAEIPVFLYSTFGQVNLFKYRTTIYSDVQSHADSVFFLQLKILLSEGEPWWKDFIGLFTTLRFGRKQG